MYKDSPKRARWTDPDTGRIVRHPYERSPYSGAGNCWCGRAYESRLHPHPYTRAYSDVLCVCASPADDEVHTDAATARREQS